MAQYIYKMLSKFAKLFEILDFGKNVKFFTEGKQL